MSEPGPVVETRQGRRFLWSDPARIERFGDPFRPLEPECKVIQFDQPLTPAQLQQAADLIVERPDVQLYVYGRASRDLSFLGYFPTLRRLHIALYELDDIAGFSHVARSLEELTYGQTKRTFSLRFLSAMPQLKKLFLVRHKRDLPVISGLGDLTGLGLSGITLPDLSLLLPLSGLRELSIFLGGTTNLALLPQLRALENLFLMRITKLSDLGMLGDLGGLTTLRLDWMRNVTWLPSLAGLARLDDVTLDTMKGLTDLSPLAAAPALRRLSVAAMPQLNAESFRCFLGHPRLRELWVGTGKSRVNDAVKRMFPGIAR
jgi:internalin A